MSNPFDSGSDSYNPFNQADTNQSKKINDIESQQTSTKTSSKTTNDTNNKGYKDPITGVYITEKELIEKERNLAEREQRIAQREREIEEAKANGTYDQLNTHKRNFPIYLNWYKYYPEEDIPEDARKMMQYQIYSVYIGFGLLMLNCVGCLIAIFDGGSMKSPAASLVYSTLYLICSIPILLELDFYTLYMSLMAQKALKFVEFIVVDSIFIIFMFFLGVGWFDFGSIGWMVAIDSLAGKAGIFLAVYSLIWSILITIHVAGLCFFWLTKYRYFTSHKFSKQAILESAAIASKYAAENKVYIKNSFIF